MKKSLRWGLLGTARINRAVISPLQKSRRNQLWGVASRNSDKSSAYAQEHSIPKFYGSYEDMLADPEIDVVYIPLPNALHAEWTIKAAQAGKHVLCEKPLALSTSDVDSVRTAAAENHVVVAEAFMYRHHPQTLLVQELIQSGAIGDIRLYQGVFSFKLERPNDVRWDSAMGGGSIWDIGCYPISYIRAALDEEPTSVIAWQNTEEHKVDTIFSGQMVFPCGAMAQVASSFSAEKHTSVLFLGSKGTLQIDSPFHPQASLPMILTQGKVVKKIKTRQMDPYICEIENMADVILDGKPQRVTLEDTLRNVETIQAFLRSAQTGKPVSLPLQG